MTAPAMPTIGKPDAVGAAAFRINQLGEGRLLLVRPTAYDPNAAGFDAGETTGCVTADIVVLDGPTPLTFGGSVQKGRPDSMRVDTLPFLASGVWIKEKQLVVQLHRKVGANEVVVGRLALGVATKGNRPWVLLDPTPADIEKANAWLVSKFSGTFVNPTPVEIIQAAPAQPAGIPTAASWGATPTVTPTPVAEPPMPPGFDPQKWAAFDLATKSTIAAGYAGYSAAPAAVPAQAAPVATPASATGW